MNGFTTLGKVSEQVAQMSKGCTDRLIAVKDVQFESIETVMIAGEPHSMSPVAQQRMVSRLKIPLPYLRKCSRSVQAYNLNHWIARERNEKLFFRFDGPAVRAVFTPRYRPADNFEVLDRLDSVGYSPDTEVQCHLNKELMALSIPDGEKVFALNDEKIVPGISIANSEVGIAALSVSAFFLRIVCTNGMISKAAVSSSYRHVSFKVLEEFPDILKTVSQQYTKQKEKFKISIQSVITDPESTIYVMNEAFHLSELEREAIKWAIPYEYGNTLFNIVNIYTRAAQYEPLSVESRHYLQKTGGQILSMTT